MRFDVLCTVSLGIVQRPKYFRAVLEILGWKTRGRRWPVRDRSMLPWPEFDIGSLRYDLDIIGATPAQLGFNSKVMLDELFPKAVEVGLSLIPADAALLVAIAKKPPLGKSWKAGMEPIMCRDGGNRVVWSLERYDKVDLRCTPRYFERGYHYSHPEQVWLFGQT